MNVVPSLYRKHFKIVSVALDRDGLAQSQHTTASTALTLNGALSSGGSYTAGDGSNAKVGHLIGVYSSANISTMVFTIVGTDPNGIAQTETVTGVNNSTVFSTKYFYTVSSVTPDTTDAVNNVEVGIGNTWATERVRIEPRSGGNRIGMGVEGSGTYNVTVQLTMSDLNDDAVVPTYINDTSFASKTATYFQDLGVLCTGVRLISSSYSSTPTLYFHVIQNK